MLVKSLIGGLINRLTVFLLDHEADTYNLYDTRDEVRAMIMLTLVRIRATPDKSIDDIINYVLNFKKIEPILAKIEGTTKG